MRTILITGASGGLAQEMVKLLPEDRLILLGRNQEKLEKLYASHPQAECIGIDITDSSAVQDLVEELYQRYGQIDILVNNAGYGIFEAFDRISDQQVREINPGPIRTTFFDQADPDRSYVKAVDRYILEPDFVAKKIVKNFGKPKRELNLPWLLNLTHKLYTLFPRISDKLASKMFNFK